MMKVKQFLSGKNIFITGASGFIGKTLIEKLLRCVPDIGLIYILIRIKRGKLPSERLNDIFENRLFDSLKKSNPDFHKKVVPIPGDASQLKLGISEENRKVLTENVDIIYHCAASIRFDDSLCKAILTNVRSTRELIYLAQEMKHLKAFIHVSTAYSQSDKRVVDEKVYQAHGHWREAIEIAENGDQDVLQFLTSKYIHPMPNTYTYAKSLAENLVNDLCTGQFPTAIARPSIVTNMAYDPVPGWTDNLNGAIGIYIASGTGVIHSALGSEDCYLDMLPVDAVTNILILCTCDVLKKQQCDHVEVYNISRYELDALPLKSHSKVAVSAIREFPASQMIWTGKSSEELFTKCRYKYFFITFFYQVIPALVVDLFLRMFGKKPRLFQIQKKLYIALTVLEYFMTNTWYFKNHKLIQLESQLSSEDLEDFGFRKKVFLSVEELKKYACNCIIQIDECVFNIKFDLQRNKRQYSRVKLISRVFNAGWYACLFWLMIKTNLIGIIYDRLVNYISDL